MAYVMVVDDDADFANVVAAVLRKDGHEVAIRLDTKSALADMEKRRPDAIVLDVMFPEDESAGFVLARGLRSRKDALKDVPILILTAINAKFPLGFSAQDIDDQWLPVSDFLEKPVDFDVLREKVAKLLEEPED